MHPDPRWQRGALVALLCSPFARAQEPITGPYDELTDTYRTVTSFNVETTRGLAFAPGGALVAINTHGSSLDVARATGAPPFVHDSYPTVNEPIAVDVWTDPATGIDYAVVLGGATHAVVLHDLATGRVRGAVQLPAETGDLVVDPENGRAFASCTGNNTVVQIALPALTIDATFHVASQRPRFLYLDRRLPGGDDNVVYVTPEVSGNNTVTSVNPELLALFGFETTEAGAVPLDPIPEYVSDEAATLDLLTNARPLDLDIPQLASHTDGLPDEDLFRIDPVTGGGGVEREAVAVLRGAGTILAAHGRSPSGDYWIVGHDARNGDLLRQSEPALRGDFVRNQVAIAAALPAQDHPAVRVTDFVDLDLTCAAGSGGDPYGAAFSIASPYALEFDPLRGLALVVGATSDRVRFMGDDGERMGDLALPPGSIPRDLSLDPTGDLLLVYCWGTNEVRYYDIAAVLQVLDPCEGPVELDAAVHSLGVDPTPESIRRGRRIFYDASRSRNGRTSCNSCHPGLGMDGLGWVIKDFPHDHKDVMVTQSLKGIEDTFPYHWRGERDLAAFNAAFPGLLGAEAALDESPGGELDDFMAFVFSVQPHANPLQDPRRILNSARSTHQDTFDVPNEMDPFPPGVLPNPVAGQAAMDLPAVLFDSFSCADCHQKVHGTTGDINFDDPSQIPTNASMDVAHFRQLFHKDQDLVKIEVSGFPVQVPRGGFGISHDGNHPSILDFLHRNPFAIDAQTELDLAAFVEQADQGIAPAAHHAWFLTKSTPFETWQEVYDVLFTQVGPVFEPGHGASAVGIGTYQDDLGSVHDLRFYYLPWADQFYASDPNVPFLTYEGSLTPFELVKLVDAQRLELLLLGVPPGDAFRFAVDRDDDGLSDDLELQLGLDPLDPDTDGDGDPDGHEYANPPASGPSYLSPTVQANDVTPPALVWWRLDHATSSTAKLVLLLSEPASVTVTATDSAHAHEVVERRYLPAALHTLTVQHLRPSLPELDFEGDYPFDDVQPDPTDYGLTVELSDLGGCSSGPIPLTDSQGAPFHLATRGQLVPLPFAPGTTPGPELAPAFLMRTVTEAVWTSNTDGLTFEATLRASTRVDGAQLASAYQDPAVAPNGSAGPEERQVFVAQVLIGSAGEWSVVPRAGVARGLQQSFDVVDAVQFRFDPASDADTPGQAPLDLPGPFVLSDESGPEGECTLRFTLSAPLLQGEELRLSIVAIAERDYRDVAAAGPNDFPHNEFWAQSAFSYQMPATAPGLRYLSRTAD